MTTTPDDQQGGLTRRQIIAGAGAAAAGAAVLGAGLPGRAGAVAPAAVPLALDAPITGLTYINIDALGFRTAAAGTNGWYSDDTSGTGALNPGYPLSAPLPLPVGSVIKQLNFAYQGTPVAFIYERPLITPQSPQAFVNQPLAAGGGPKTQTIAVDLTIKAGSTYAIRLNVDPGDSIYGVTIGYMPPPQGFVPFTGSNPRALDTRSGAKIGAGEERTLDLTAFGAVGRAAVLNLTAADAGGYGYLSVYSADLAAWPGNSSLNYTTAGQTIANGVIATLGAGNKIKIRAGETSVHAVVDVIGYLL